METAATSGNARSKGRIRNFSGIVRELIDFEEDFDLLSEEREVRRLIERHGKISLDGSIGELI